jgi:hypothetical protein
LSEQPVDGPGAIGHQIGAPSGEDAQLHDAHHRTATAADHAHPGLISDDRSFFGVALGAAAIAPDA